MSPAPTTKPFVTWHTIQLLCGLILVGLFSLLFALHSFYTLDRPLRTWPAWLVDVDIGLCTFVFGLLLIIVMLARLQQGLQQKDELQQQEIQRLALVVAHANSAIIITDAQGCTTWINAAFERLTGYSFDDLRGKKPGHLLQRGSSDSGAVGEMRQAMQDGKGFQVEITNFTKDGHEYWVSIVAQPIFGDDGKITGYFAVETDVTEQRSHQKELERLAFTDVATGLPNRSWFIHQLNEALHAKERTGILVFLHFPRFGILRGSLGRDKTDLFIAAAGQRLQESLMPGQIMARFGSGSFAVFIQNPEPGGPIESAGRFATLLSRPFAFAKEEVQMIANAGIAVIDSVAHDGEELVRDAEIAGHSLMLRNVSDVALFNPEMKMRLIRRQSLETDLRRAIYFDTNQLSVVYQPIVRLVDNRLVGFEALSRWNIPGKEIVPPDDFIPVAEESGLIVPLWCQLFVRACRNLMAWQKTQPHDQPALFMSINLSSHQFFQSRLIRIVDTLLAVTGVNPRHVKLELTESGVMEDTEVAIQQMQYLRERGFFISIDDFGAGYSSLSYLHRLPVDDLKIDRSFVATMHDSESNREIIRTIVRLGQLLGLRVTAEGIETAADLTALRDMQCDLGQGYFFARPIDEATAAELVRSMSSPLGGPVDALPSAQSG